MLTKIFLESLGLSGGGSIALGGLLALFAVFAIIIVFVLITIYIYMSFVYMNIAKKANYPTPGLAWIPYIGPGLISSKLAKMHWWPVLLLIGLIILPLSGLFMLAFMVFFIIWTWKVFEGFGKPGWWAIFWLIWPVELVMLGIMAFGEAKYFSK